MARDILAIPITTVASKATFSARSRVIDTYRAFLAPETVQALLYGGNWCRNFHGVKKKNKVSFSNIILITNTFIITLVYLLTMIM